MNDFKTVAYSGMYFVNIVFERASGDVDNIVVELFRDGLKMNVYLCDGADMMLTIQPLAEGSYSYTVSQISETSVFKADGKFNISLPTFSVVKDGRYISMGRF